MHLPIVETSWNYVGLMYGQLKQSNNVLHWAFGRAESSFNFVVNTTSPVAVLFKSPILTLDKLLFQGLNTVEEKVPSIALPPEQIYSNTKQYINDVGSKIAHPILKRANSVKQIGNTVLDSKYTLLAADKLDGALNVVDKYVDKYLPADALDADIEETDASKAAQENNLRGPYKTIHHMDRFSRKLQRRVTRRTLVEAKALKEHSTEAIHVLTYAIEMLATDPKLVHQKVHEIWDSLSKDEPENQASPQNLEELVVMLTRESARRFVHFVNFAQATINTLPIQLVTLKRKCQDTIDELIKHKHQGNLNQIILKESRLQAYKFTLLLHQLNLYTGELLVHVAKILEEQEQLITSSSTTTTVNQVHSPTRHRIHTTTTTVKSYKLFNKHNNVVNGSDNSHA